MKISNPLLDQLEYVILPGKPPFGFQHPEPYRRAFDFWKSFWTEAYRLDSVPVTPHPDDFVRQDFITVFMHSEQVIGLHAYTLFDLAHKPICEHSYFRKYFPPEVLSNLKELGLHRVMSMEYWGIAPEWRSARVHASLGIVLAMLGMRLAREVGAETIITAARTDISSANVAYDTGAKALRSGVEVYGKPTDLVYWTMDSIRPSKHARVNAMAAAFWPRRLDTTGRTSTSDAGQMGNTTFD